MEIEGTFFRKDYGEKDIIQEDITLNELFFSTGVKVAMIRTECVSRLVKIQDLIRWFPVYFRQLFNWNESMRRKLLTWYEFLLIFFNPHTIQYYFRHKFIFEWWLIAFSPTFSSHMSHDTQTKMQKRNQRRNCDIFNINSFLSSSISDFIQKFSNV